MEYNFYCKVTGKCPLSVHKGALGHKKFLMCLIKHVILKNNPQPTVNVTNVCSFHPRPSMLHAFKKKSYFKTLLLLSPLDKLHHDYEMSGKDVVVLWLRQSVADPSPPRYGLDQMGSEVNKVEVRQVNPWYSSVSIILPASHTHSSIIELIRSNHTERSAVYFWSQVYIISSRQPASGGPKKSAASPIV